MLQSLNCGTLQDGALWCDHQSVAHTVEEKCCTRCHVFKCHCDTFAAVLGCIRILGDGIDLRLILWYNGISRINTIINIRLYTDNSMT